MLLLSVGAALASATALFIAIQPSSAHLTRAGYFDTPSNATASSSSSSSASVSSACPRDCISSRNFCCSASASSTGLPTTSSLITDVDAWLIEQPSPSQPSSAIAPSATRTRSVTSSPQVGLTWCTSASNGSSRPRCCGCL